jgi:NAD(P)H-hydrate epimerase
MKPVLDVAQTRAQEEAAGRMGRPPSVLMESAGTAVAGQAERMARPGARFLVVCGPGNNGGDGFVAARKLLERGKRVDVERVGGEKAKGDAERNWEALKALLPSAGTRSFEPGQSDVVVDALFGVGLGRAPSGPFAEAIERFLAWRSRGAQVLAVDLPSGLESDTGQPLGPCVQADATVTFGGLKPGTVLEPGASLCGAVSVADIGLPPLGGAPSAWLVEEQDVRSWIPKRAASSHKGTFGHVLIIAGSRGKSGAAAMAGLGSLRAGAGLTTVACPGEVLEHVLGHAPELMGVALSARGGLGPKDLETLGPLLERFTAVAVGPGIPRGEETLTFLRQLLAATGAPVLLDADALNALAGDMDVLRAARGPVVLTPHPGEMSRLSGQPTAVIQGDRLKAARELAVAHRVVLALKGASTVVALPSGELRINPTGNPGMATGGTGDVLTGICAALLAQGLKPDVAATAAVYVHGLSGDLMAKLRGQMGLIATDLLEGLSEVWAGWGR